jgi:hypothetical protein
LATAIDLGQDNETFITFLVRQNTAPLLPSQTTSPNRTLSLEMLDAAGQSQFDFTFLGQQTDFAIGSQADAAGADVTADGFVADTVYLFVGKIAGNGAGANSMQASLLASGSAVGNFTDPLFAWTLTAQGSDGYNPVVTQLQFASQAAGNYSVSNVWIGDADDFFAPPVAGDFNANGVVDAADLPRWQSGVGMDGVATHWYGDADNDADVDGADFLTWQRRLGSAAPAVPANTPVPEPATALLLIAAAASISASRRPNASTSGQR